MHTNMKSRPNSNSNSYINGDFFGYCESKEESPKSKRIHMPSVVHAISVKKSSSGSFFELNDTNESEVIPFKEISLEQIAERMKEMLLTDLNEGVSDAVPDMLGHIDGTFNNRKLDALIWVYDLNPNEVQLSFEWMCEMLDLDAQSMRRIIGRSVRQEMFRVLNILASMVSPEYAIDCEIALAEYVNLDGWRLK